MCGIGAEGVEPPDSKTVILPISSCPVGKNMLIYLTEPQPSEGSGFVLQIYVLEAGMAAKKVYAVRRGKATGILEDWEACKAAVEGYPGAEYKSFKTLEEARVYLGGNADPAGGERMAGKSAAGIGETAGGVEVSRGVTADKSAAGGGAEVSRGKTADKSAADRGVAAGRGSLAERKTRGDKKRELLDREKRPLGMGDIGGGLVAYVDGSYEHSVRRYAFGCVFILPDDTVYVENGSGSNPDTAQLRNVSGEMLGAMFAVRWAIKNGFRGIELRYDYEGIEKWVTGAWKSRTELTRKYAEAMRRWMNSIQMRFTKVEAHANVYYNELADRLAKDGLMEREDIPEVWLMEEMEPWAKRN